MPILIMIETERETEMLNVWNYLFRDQSAVDILVQPKGKNDLQKNDIVTEIVSPCYLLLELQSRNFPKAKVYLLAANVKSFLMDSTGEKNLIRNEEKIDTERERRKRL